MTGRVFTDACEGCALRLANGQQTVCDGSGVIAITDYPESRVVVCPEWPCDQDEPLAYWQAIDGLGYDQMPATMQQRIRDNLMASIVAPANVNCEPLHEPHPIVSAEYLIQVQRVSRWGRVIGISFLCAVFAYIWWMAVTR